MTSLIVATRNAHKTREIQTILGREFEVSDLSSHPEIPETVESGKTLEENAIIKALAVSAKCEGLVLADDSGLEVDALGGAPGVFSARYAGEKASDQANIEKLHGELKSAARSVASGSWSARFRCVIALARGNKVLGTFNGAVEGSIIAAVRGRNGFGYDPIFVPRGFDQTFGELSSEIKSRISHRARAIAALRQGMRHGSAQ